MRNLTYLNKSILLVLVFVATCFTAKAQFGSNISYHAIDSIKYEVVLTIYRDCSGSPSGNTATIEVFGKSSGAFKATLNKSTTTDITGIGLKCPQKSRCSGSFAYGIQEIVYKGEIDISGGGCKYSFLYTNCCRPSSISTGPANSTHYNTATVNKCYGLNTSTQILQPRIIIGVGQDFRGKVFIGDTTNTQDSVVYSMVSALSAPTNPVTYSGAYDHTKPITFLGFPNAALFPPAGLQFDRSTSELGFRPTKVNEVALFCFEAREFRKINGVMELIGTSRIEYVVIVASMPNNKVPYIDGQSVVACTGANTSITIDAKDFDNNDSTFLDITNLPKGATVNYTRNGNKAQATVSWTPKQSDVRSKPYAFVVTAKDNACPFNGVATRCFSFSVRESPPSTDIKITSKDVKCSSAEVILDINSGIKNPVITITDEDDISFATDDTARLFFKGSGWKKFTVKVSSNNYCDYILTDSVLINPQYSLQLNTKADSSICPNSTVNFFSNPQNGTSPYSTIWYSGTPQSTKSSSSSFSEAINTITYNKVRVVDSNYCIGLDSTTIDVYAPPVIKADKKEVEVCPNTPFQLSASYVSGANPIKYEWLGIDTLPIVSTQSNLSQIYFVEATSKEGCKAIDSTQLKLFPIEIDAGNYTTVCRNTSVKLNANAITGLSPYTFTWLHDNTNANTSTANVSADSSFVIRLSDGRGCIAYDTAFITTYLPTQYQIPTSATICAGAPINLQLSNIIGDAPFSFVWDGKPSTDSSDNFTLQQTKNIPIDIIDKNNCKVSDNINVIVNQNPDSRLGADKKVCQGTSEKLTAFVIGGKKPLNYLWSTGNQTDSITVLVNTPQEVILLVTDDNGCIDRDTITLDTLPSRKATLTPLVNPFCDDAPPVSLKSIPNNGTWTGAGVNGKIFNPNTAGAGVHPLTFSFISIYNCSEEDEIVAIVKQTPKPDFTVDKTKGYPNTVFSFTDLTTADTTYTSEWNMGDGSSLLTTPSVNHTYTNVGKYTVTLKVDNGVCAIQTLQKTSYVEVDSIFTSVTQLEKEGIKVYPNPVSETLFLTSEQNITAITLFDVLGKKIILQKTNALSTEINVSALDKGVYTLSIVLENGVTNTTKIIIQ